MYVPNIHMPPTSPLDVAIDRWVGVRRSTLSNWPVFERQVVDRIVLPKFRNMKTNLLYDP